MPIMFRPLLISLCLTSTALATTWTVDDDGKADFDNIQAAIDAASDGDEIIVMPGTYTSTGSPVVWISNKEIWLHSSEGQGVTIIDGEGWGRGIECGGKGATSKTIIEGFTITNGYYNYGGGMYNYESSPTLTDCTFTNNTAEQHGGGMGNNSSNPTLTNCTFTNNTAEYAGGGGGMYNNHSNPTLTGCIFDNNSVTLYGGGGGMHNDNSSPSLTDCTFNDNTAYNRGGGIYNENSQFTTLENCTFTGNTADYGGGMYNYGSSSTTLTDTTVCGNSPDQIYGYWIDNGGNCIAESCDDANGNGIPDDCGECLEDINGDGYVNVTDLLSIIDQWGLTNSPADVNEDGIVDVSDLLIVVGNWGPCE